MINKNIELLMDIKESAESSIGRVNFYRIASIIAFIYIIIDFIAIIVMLIMAERILAILCMLHISLSIKLIKNTLKVVRYTVASVVKKSPKVIESIKEKDKEKFMEFVHTSEEIQGSDSHQKTVKTFWLLILLYIAIIAYAYAHFSGIIAW